MGLRWIAFMLFYSTAVLPSCTGDVEERPELIPISCQGMLNVSHLMKSEEMIGVHTTGRKPSLTLTGGIPEESATTHWTKGSLSDSPMSGDEGTQGPSDIAYTMEDFEREDTALTKKEEDFKGIKDEFSRRLFDHQTEKSEFEKYKSETEENIKREEYGKEGEEEELEASLKQLEEEKRDLKKDVDELDKAEKEIQKAEATLNDEMVRIKTEVEDLKKKEDDLETLIADLETKKKELESEFTKQDIIEQKKHGECVDIPEGLKRFLNVSERENGKICNQINQNDDPDDYIGEEYQ